MTDRRATVAFVPADPKIATDWDAVLKRLAELDSRSGGDTRRRAILARLRVLRPAS